MIFPPATPLPTPTDSSQMNSPSMTGTRQNRRVPSNFAFLKSVPKEPQLGTEWHRIRTRSAVENGRCRTGHQALSCPVQYGLGQCLTGEGEGQQRQSRTTIRRLVLQQAPFDTTLGITPNHGRAIATKRLCGRMQPMRVNGGDQQPRELHRKRFAIGVGHGRIRRAGFRMRSQSISSTFSDKPACL